MTLRARLLLSFGGIAICAGILSALPGMRLLQGPVLAFAVLVATAVVSWLLLNSILQPVQALKIAVEEIASGPTLREIKMERAPREIESLVDAFNRMQASIRERRRLNQEKLMRSDRLAVLGQLAAGVAHEINNPLGSILLFTRLVLQQTPEGPARENLERIEKETKRCHAIVQSLLDFARQREPRIETVDINQLVETATRFFEGQSIFRNIEVIRRYHENLPPVQADPLQMQQVFINLILNAADAMNGSGRLTLETAELPGEKSIGITVSDTGCGIPSENLDRIFDPFFTTKEVGRGTGLGLSVSYGIVEAHHGEIRVSSIPGEGSRFTIALPRSKESA
jgi:two-component system, NtrC family, sensor kinase